MCGICGVYNYGTDEPAGERLVRQMTASMLHRGPDDDGFLFDGSLGLGMRRLSIIDLAGGAQPIGGEHGAVQVVANGEIYNFHDLRRELEAHGHTFRTRSDTEVIVHAYEQWGLDALARLNGMFGLALWDGRERRLVLARDPFGVKPLYYHDDGRSLLFGSTVRAILRHPGVPRTVDPRALDEYLTFGFVPSPRTAFAGISRLLPGHALVCGPAGAVLHRFHRVIPRPIMGRSEGEIVEELRGRIVRAITRQMVADVPVGVLLSGGVDSATVATIMAQVSPAPIKTFTVGFEGDFPGNELTPARETARRIGSEHHEVIVSAGSFAEFLPAAIERLEEPVATTSTLPFYEVCELARRHVTVVLTGQGADEPFAGYGRYLGERYGGLYRRLPTPIRAGLIAPLVERLPRNDQLKRGVRALSIEDPAGRLAGVYAVVHGPLKRRLYRPGLLPVADGALAVARWQREVAGLDPLGRMLYVDARLQLPDNLLLYGDKMSMAVSLEARVPFLDLELMTFVESLPSALKVRGLTRKHILKAAVAPWIGQDVVRRRKLGFVTPVDGWFRGALRGMVQDRLLDPGSACRAYFAPGALRALIEQHHTGRHNHQRVLFALLTFELWHERFIRSSATSEPKPVADSGAGRLM